MSIYKLYETNESKEKNGVVCFFANEELRLTLARAGGGNTRYSKLIAAKAKPHKRAIQSGTMPEEKSQEILYRAFAEAIIIKWETLVDNEYKPVIETKEGPKPVSPELIVQVFKDLPDLFLEIHEEANRLANFRDEERETDEKN
jgi:hypothetical protein